MNSYNIKRTSFRFRDAEKKDVRVRCVPFNLITTTSAARKLDSLLLEPRAANLNPPIHSLLPR
jgi:hypothetical protein